MLAHVRLGSNSVRGSDCIASRRTAVLLFVVTALGKEVEQFSVRCRHFDLLAQLTHDLLLYFRIGVVLILSLSFFAGFRSFLPDCTNLYYVSRCLAQLWSYSKSLTRILSFDRRNRVLQVLSTLVDKIR